MLFIGWLRNNFKPIPWYFYIICIVGIVLPWFIYPIMFGLKLGKLIYIVDNPNADTIKFVAFGTLWRDQRTIIANINDIKINRVKERKLLYKKYELNIVYIRGGKFFIFSELLSSIPRYTA